MVKVNCISGYTSERNKRVAYGFHLQLVPCNAQTLPFIYMLTTMSSTVYEGPTSPPLDMPGLPSSTLHHTGVDRRSAEPVDLPTHQLSSPRLQKRRGGYAPVVDRAPSREEIREALASGRRSRCLARRQTSAEALRSGGRGESDAEACGFGVERQPVVTRGAVAIATARDRLLEVDRLERGGLGGVGLTALLVGLVFDPARD